MRTFLSLLIVPLLVLGQLPQIAGPVITAGSSPWTWYDSAEAGNAATIGAAAIANPPVIGAASAGTWTTNNVCSSPTFTFSITNTSTGAAEFTVGQTAIIAWNSVAGTAAGRMVFFVGSIVGNTMFSSNQCFLPTNMVSQSGLTVYHCPSCDTPTSSMNIFWWQAGNGNPWNFYDSVHALYLYYQRTGNPSDLTAFRNFADLWWLWALNSGGFNPNPPRSASLLGQFDRALDGHPERLTPLYNMVVAAGNAGTLGYYNGNDNREPGYVLLYLAVGARADPTNRASYCSLMEASAQTWVTYQTPTGIWPEKNGFYPYAVGGYSPWRIFAVNQGLARAYDVLSDGTCGAGQATLASNILTALKASASSIYNAGFTQTNKALFYDIDYPDDGQDGLNNGVGPGTISATIGSNAVVGSGTSFLSSFTPGVTYIGIGDTGVNGSLSWTYLVTAVADNTHLTIAQNYGFGQYIVGSAALAGGADYITGGGSYPCPSYVTSCAVLIPRTSSGTYYIAAPAPTNCNTTATSCWAGVSVPGAPTTFSTSALFSGGAGSGAVILATASGGVLNSVVTQGHARGVNPAGGKGYTGAFSPTITGIGGGSGASVTLTPTTGALTASSGLSGGTGYTGSYLLGDPDNIRDSIWIMGWLYKTTGIKQYQTWGDTLFAASYGGPAAGAGSSYNNAFAGACGGPGCNGYESDYMLALPSCAQSFSVPCDPQNNVVGQYGNAFQFLGKRYGQGSGIGGADNYLAWRLGFFGGKISPSGVTSGIK